MHSKPTLDELFDQRHIYPDIDARTRLDRLIGVDDQKARLSKILGLLVHPAGLELWAKRHHPGAATLLDSVLRRPPLVILSGDVGSGKTELAETIGDAVARQEKIDITLFPLSLATRGKGQVGEMTQLLTAAFDYALAEATKLQGRGKSTGGVILLVDEADALTQSRESAQMHHEDRAGVNAFIRGIDRLAQAKVPAAVIMCTNRLNALDPAVRRRAADILTFNRPDSTQRRYVLEHQLQPLGLSSVQIEGLVEATGAKDGQEVGFTYSDITQRLIPSIVLDAYPDSSVESKRALEIARPMQPTPAFQDHG
ncbi:AAA family ATPase [Stenotrophomonas lactitubi]|uniref:AAA family ATPase n=1 Tax=Stenotrophomonas lactitubi TaxID=2045214 RepID=UPI0019BE4EE7|nr:AAA family ATPase [Stenotrophomonas lactitubi]MBD3774627.1 AAA family ATPase [Paracoccaceae bacterium]